jgi:serine/threonine-protein kinase
MVGLHHLLRGLSSDACRAASAAGAPGVGEGRGESAAGHAECGSRTPRVLPCPMIHLAHFNLPLRKRAFTIEARPKGHRVNQENGGTFMSRYEIDPAPIGEGGFGKVRKGRDPELDRPVAIKTLDPLWAAATPDDKERFKREAKILAKLAHPNIPAIYDVEFTENEFRIVFQYIEGKNLRQILGEEPPSITEVRSWFSQVASALQHAHETGIVHRDIKPENLIVTNDRRHCYLVDFGLALSKAEAQRLTPFGWTVGTAGYMSPEQQDGELPEASDDVYVLAMCLYEAFCGHSITPGTYEDLSTKNEAIPPSIDELILDCLQPRAQRIKQASEFARRLRAAFQALQSVPLSVVLTQGKLYEVIEAIRPMSPSDFMQLPPGQRILLLERGADLISNTDHRLTLARGEFLTVLCTLAIHVEEENYKEIITPAVVRGYEEQIGVWVGDRKTRDAIAQAAGMASQPNHGVIAKAVLECLQRKELDNRDTWFLHEMRKLIYTLMANTHCDEKDATSLGKMLAKINGVQRYRESNQAPYEANGGGEIYDQTRRS